MAVSIPSLYTVNVPHVAQVEMRFTSFLAEVSRTRVGVWTLACPMIVRGRRPRPPVSLPVALVRRPESDVAAARRKLHSVLVRAMVYAPGQNWQTIRISGSVIDITGRAGGPGGAGPSSACARAVGSRLPIPKAGIATEARTDLARLHRRTGKFLLPKRLVAETLDRQCGTRATGK
jgi:hypothetical protein